MLYDGIFQFNNVLGGLNEIVDWIESTFERISSIFADVDFTILYDWLPSDISGVITAIIAVLLFLALFGLLRRILFFLG